MKHDVHQCRCAMFQKKKKMRKQDRGKEREQKFCDETKHIQFRLMRITINTVSCLYESSFIRIKILIYNCGKKKCETWNSTLLLFFSYLMMMMMIFVVFVVITLLITTDTMIIMSYINI